MPADDFLPAIGHAVSGASGTAISTSATYPLDLVNTRLKVQRQLRKDGAISRSEGYRGIADALAKVYAREGGLGALYAGLGADVAKGVADSFLFFLFYSWFRSRRSRGSGRQLPAWEELAVGAAAGACARLFTTPVSNVVTRKQTASLLATNGDGGGEPSFGEILHVIRAEKGLLGLWSGYSATLVLTLNPSLTFYLQTVLKKALVDSGREGESSGATFLVAAVSKVFATAITYPFQVAKARSQVSAPDSTSSRSGKRSSKSEEKHRSGTKKNGKRSKDKMKAVPSSLRNVAEETIFGTVYRMGRTEGIPALYAGLGGELLKAFLNHGTTMLSKEFIHKLVVRLYFMILAFIRRSPAAQALLRRRSSEDLRKLGGARFAEMFSRLKDGSLAFNLLERTQKLIVTR